MSWRWLRHLTVSCVQNLFAMSNIVVVLSVAEEILMMESSLERSSHTYHRMYWYHCAVFINLHDVIERYFGRQYSYCHFLHLILDQHAVILSAFSEGMLSKFSFFFGRRDFVFFSTGVSSWKSFFWLLFLRLLFFFYQTLIAKNW